MVCVRSALLNELTPYSVGDGEAYGRVREYLIVVQKPRDAQSGYVGLTATGTGSHTTDSSRVSVLPGRYHDLKRRCLRNSGMGIFTATAYCPIYNYFLRLKRQSRCLTFDCATTALPFLSGAFH